MTESSPNPLIRVRSAPAQLANCRRTSNAVCALLPVRGVLPKPTLMADRSGEQLPQFLVALAQMPPDVVIHSQRLLQHE
jgi:hypothetical protein